MLNPREIVEGRGLCRRTLLQNSSILLLPDLVSRAKVEFGVPLGRDGKHDKEANSGRLLVPVDFSGWNGSFG